MIHQTNLVIEARDCTLDVERDNVESLANDIILIREEWNSILEESKIVAENIGITSEFSTGRTLRSQQDAENHYRVNVFFVIIDSISSGLTRRFESLNLICAKFGFLWQFLSRTDQNIHSGIDKFIQEYRREVEEDLHDEITFLKQTYSTNFKIIDCKPKTSRNSYFGIGENISEYCNSVKNFF